MKLSESKASIFTIASFGLCIAAEICYFIFKVKIWDTISAIGFTMSMLPFLLLQIRLVAGLDGPFVGAGSVPVAFKWVFYGFIFPFVDAIVVCGVCSIFNIFPRTQLINGVATFIDNRLEYWLLAAVLYFMIIITGSILGGISKKKPALR